MAESSISQPSLSPELRRLSGSLDPAWVRGLGLELRRRRRERGLTQEALALPLTKGYVSAVERGRIVPSLPALRLMVTRLDTTLAAFFAAVDASLSTED